MLIGVIQRFINIICKSLTPEEAVKIFRSIGRNITIIGISLVISILISHYLEQNWFKNYLFLKGVNISSVIWILIGLIMIVYGISILANYGTKEKFMKVNGLKTRKLILVQSIKQLKYAMIVTIILVYINILLDDNITWNTNIFFRVTSMNILVIYFLLSLGVKIILNSFTIFKSSIPDSKDRLTIIVTIFATIISAIALFK
ncbi:hypothetical protein [Lysinibacillus xylanilyticus]|uniref:hypothetical protein n=1 Tax=Lysinibacillus xylanilyticus TaxID=582475 RepID=UPI0037FED076